MVMGTCRSLCDTQEEASDQHGLVIVHEICQQINNRPHGHEA